MPWVSRLLLALVFVAFMAAPGTAASLNDAKAKFAAKHYVAARAAYAEVLLPALTDDTARPAKDLPEARLKEALGQYGWTLFLLDEYAASRDVFARFARFDPKNFEARLGLAWNAIKLGAYDEAEGLLTKADDLASRRERPAVDDARGWLAVKRGDYKAARGSFKREEARQYEEYGGFYIADSQVGLGWVAIFQNDWDAAANLFREGLQRDGNCLFCRDGLARVRLQASKPRDALAEAVHGARLTRHNYGLVTLVDQILLAIGDVKVSIETYRDLAAAHEGDAVWEVRHANALVAAGKAEDGRKLLTALVGREPDNALARAALRNLKFAERAIVSGGWELYARGDYARALDSCTTRRDEAKGRGSAAAEDCRGWALVALNRPREAAEAFKAALAIDRDFFYAETGLTTARQAQLGAYNAAWAQLDAGRHDEAAKAFAAARAGVDADLQWLVDDGLAWVESYRGNRAAARMAFESIVAANPDAYLSQRGLGLIALDEGQHQRAVEFLTKSFERSPNQAIASYTGPAMRLVEAGRHAEAKGVLDLAERAWPLSADVQFLAARAYKGLGDERQASEKAMAAVTLAPAYVDPAFDGLGLSAGLARDAYLALGWGLYYAGMSDAARNRIRQYFAAGGSDRSGHLGLGWTELTMGDAKAAEVAFRKALAAREDADALAGVGWARLGQDDPAAAESSFRRALGLIAGHISAGAGIAAVKFRLTAIVKDGWERYYRGAYAEALVACEAKRDAARSARNPAAEDCRGWSLLALGRPEEAEKAFAAALAIDPAFFYSESGRIAAKRAGLVTYDEAWSLAMLGRHDEAKAKFERARVGLGQEFLWLIDDGLAWLDYYRGNHDAAKRAFERIVAANSQAYLSRKGLGYVAVAQKDWRKAADELTRSYTVAPYQPVAAYTEPAFAMIEAGRHEEARGILDGAAKVWPLSADVQILLARAQKGLRNEDAAAAHAIAAARLAPAYIDPAFDGIGLPAAKVRDGLLALGWGLYYAGRGGEAIRRFDQYLGAGGGDVAAHLGRGWAALALGDGKAAEAAFRKALAAGENADAHAGLGYVALAADREADAEKSFLRSFELAPGYAPAQSGIGTVKFRQTVIVRDGWDAYWRGEYQKAFDACTARRDEATRRKSAAAEDCRGWALLGLERHEDAAKAFEAALKIDPGFFYSQSGLVTAKQAGMARYKEAWRLIGEKRWADAAARLAKARDDVEPALRWLIDDATAWIEFYKGNHAKAAQDFETVLRASPQAYLSRTGLGFVAAERRDYARAVEHLTASFTVAPYQAIASYTTPAVKMLDARKFEEARAVLALGERAWPLSADIHFLLARAAKGLGDEAGATRRAVVAAGLAPAIIDPAFDSLGLPADKVREGYHALAWGLYFARDNEAALRRFDQYIAAGGDDPNAVRGRAFVLFRLDRMDEAMTGLNKVVGHERDNRLQPIVENIPIPGTDAVWPLAYDASSTLAWALLRKGDTKGAEQAFRKVLEKRPFWIDTLTGLGYSLDAQGRKDEARSQFAEALKLAPTYPDALQGYAKVGGGERRG
ncbi:MAG: tetratricopeptide repeat protein [Alphaproteobacteria bacterium]|nr:tetratricopeptide repeat protein [Alphaproteobacteria bacterium]